MIYIYSVNTLYYMYHNMVIFKIPPSFYVLFSCVFFKGTIFAARFRLSLVISA